MTATLAAPGRIPAELVTAHPRVLGLDLSLTAAGVAGIGWADTLTTVKKLRGETDHAATHRRIAWIKDTLVDRYLHGVDLAVIEGASVMAHNGGGAADKLAGLRWIVRHSLHNLGIAYVMVPPSTAKIAATGNGAATKADMIAAVRGWHPWFAGDDNAADAAVLVAIGRAHLGDPVAELHPRADASLRKLLWPPNLARP